MMIFHPIKEVVLDKEYKERFINIFNTLKELRVDILDELYLGYGGELFLVYEVKVKVVAYKMWSIAYPNESPRVLTIT